MKKLFTLIFLAGIILSGYSQEEISEKYQVKILPGSEINGKYTATPPMHVSNNHLSGTKSDISEVIIGITYYDFQTNTMLDNRIHQHEDGAIGAVWTFGLEASSFPGRGTGYNFYNGSEWGPQPTERIESIKCGWPSYAPWGSNGEIVVSHDFAASELYILTRENKGNGVWNESKFEYSSGPPALSWPRMITSGAANQYIHMVSNTVDEYMGQTAGMVYSRSEDGGATWSPENIILDGTGAGDIVDIGADDYVMASNGNTVCILVGGWTTDLIYMRSDDNGETWDKHIVWEHPYPLWDTETEYTDTFFCIDNSAQIAVDNNGHAHVVFGIARGQGTEDFLGWYIYAPYDGIAYWNDEMDEFSGDINALAPPQLGYSGTEMVVDQNYIGWMQDVDGDGVVTLEGIMSYRFNPGMSTMPTITVDEWGRRFVLFSSNTETYVYTSGTEPVNYKHIWGRAYENGSWGPFIDVTGGVNHLFDECVYATLSKTSDNNIHYIFQADIGPGTALDGEHDWWENKIIYGTIPKTDLLTGMGEQDIIDNSHVSQNYPNPFSGVTYVNVNLDQSAKLSLVVTNLNGQRVLRIDKGLVNAQTHTFEIDATELQPGVYFYTVFANNSKVTRKMIIQ